MTAVPHVIILMTDQHARHAAGAYGNVTVQTPHLDAFAARGTAFDNAYCASPMCVPSRAALMTGRPVHETRSWDNAHPYTGVPEGWAHVVRSAGMRTAVIGKMHFRSPDDDTGFDEVILPLDVSDGIGDVYSLVRDDMPARPALAALVRQAGVGTSPYLDYDRAVADAACRWLDAAPEGEPWALLVSFATPHHPLVVPQEYWDLYPEVDVSTALVAGDDEPAHQHPYPAELRRVMGVESAFTVEEVTRARRAYYGLCTLADRLVGQVLDHATEPGFRRLLHGSRLHLRPRGLLGRAWPVVEAPSVRRVGGSPVVGHGSRLRARCPRRAPRFVDVHLSHSPCRAWGSG